MKSWYDRYGVWIALTVFASISFISLVGFNPTYIFIQKLCSPNDKGDCLRQWVSASSGWFGGAITLATLIVLSRQVNDVRTHHRETIAQAKLPVYLRAKRVVDATTIARITLELIADAVTTAEQNGPTTNGLFRMRAGIKSLKNDLSRPEFDSFENDTGYVGFGSASAMRSSLQMVIDLIDALVDVFKANRSAQIDDAEFNSLKERVSSQKYTEAYLDGISAAAEKYIRDWDITSGAA